MQKYTIFLSFLFIILPKIAYANFIDDINKGLHNFGNNLSQSVNHIIKKPAQIKYQKLAPHLIKKEKPKIIHLPVSKKKIAIIGDWEASYLGDYLKNIYEKNSYIEIYNLAKGCQDTEAKSCYSANLTAIDQPQLTSEVQSLKEINPDLLIVFIGANDFPDVNDLFKERVQNFFNNIKLVSQQIIWVSVPPYQVRANDKNLENYLDLQKYNNVLKQHNEIYETLCQQNNLTYINLEQDFLNAYNSKAQLLAPDTIGFTETALNIIGSKLENSLQDLSNNAKDNYKPNQNFVIIPSQTNTNIVYNINETLDHSPILLGSLLENRKTAILKPQFNAWPPKGRADNFNLF